MAIMNSPCGAGSQLVICSLPGDSAHSLVNGDQRHTIDVGVFGNRSRFSWINELIHSDLPIGAAVGPTGLDITAKKPPGALCQLTVAA